MIKEINNTDRAYFAGLLDGEGTILISRSKNKNNNYGYMFRVQFGLTYKKILTEMQTFFGGNIYEQDMNKTKKCNSSKRLIIAGASPENWKQIYHYHLTGKEALYFLKVVEPFCREKKEQAKLGIKYEQERRPFAGSYGRSDSETKRCEFFYRELQKLKHEKQSDIVECTEEFEDNQMRLIEEVVEEPIKIETEIITTKVTTEKTTEKKIETKALENKQASLSMFVEN